MNRRQFLASVAMGATAVSTLGRASPARASAPGTTLSIIRRTLEVKGKAASVYGLVDGHGKPGLVVDAGTTLDLALDNRSAESTLVHWHGLTPPWRMDGVPDNPAGLLAPSQTRAYALPSGEGGTHWMHAHTLQEQSLLAAPLIVQTAADRAADEQEVVLMLHDFSFRSPEELLAGLKVKNGSAGSMHAMHGATHDMSGDMDMNMDMDMDMDMDAGTGMPGMAMSMDINDIEYDAYLANDRTLDDPEIVRVEKVGRVRLRVINGAAATGFTIDTGTQPATLIAVDGRAVVPVKGNRFPVSMGQRLDIRLQLPGGDGAFPVLALREGAPERTGLILATAGAEIARMSGLGVEKGPVLDLGLEQQLRALAPLRDKGPDRQYAVMLGGDMASYEWTMEAEGPLATKSGERVRIDLMNMSMMAHPIHLHGHHFQVVAINGKRMSGAMRDTVLMPPMASVSIAFDAQNPGRWPLHCHHLYHMATGMMTFVSYEDGS